MNIEFPTNVSAYATPFAVAFAVGVITQILKPYLKDWRWTTLMAWGLGEIIAVVAALIMAAWKPSSEQLFAGFMVGLFGSALSILGYEGIVNILGLLGKGKRSDAALLVQARETINK